MSTQLPIADALAMIKRAQKLSPHRPWRLTVAIANPGGLSAHQTVDVETIQQGFDWTASQLIVKPAKPLSVLTPEQLVELGESARQGQSWHAYQREKANRAALKERDERITELERENAELRALLSECRDYVAEARQMLALCHTDPITGKIDQYGAKGVAEDDVLIAKIDASIAKEGGK